jgi:hypothetical protein
MILSNYHDQVIALTGFQNNIAFDDALLTALATCVSIVDHTEVPPMKGLPNAPKCK